MTERYQRLFSLPEALYAPNAPVIIVAGALLKDNQTGRVLCQLKLKSISPKTIKAAKVKVFPLDTVKKPLVGETVYEYLDLAISRDREFGQKSSIYLPNASTRAFSVEVTEVDFADDSVWASDKSPWEPLPATESVGDSELTKQYKLHYGDKAQYKPVRYKGGWICACGAVNGEEENGCHICGNMLSKLLACDMKALDTEKDERLARETAEREVIAAAEKAAAVAKAKKIKKILSLAIPVLIVCLAAVLLYMKVFIPNSHYNRAKALLDAGQYKEAISAFEALKGYKDSAELIKEAFAAKEEVDYSTAVALAESKKYAEAAAVFDTLGDYRESMEWLAKIRPFIVQAGETITFGHYEQDNNTSNGKEDIEWLVLAKDGNRIFLTSKYLLDFQQFSTSYFTEKTWDVCSLRKWLNESFLDTAFSVEEQAIIPCVPVSVEDPGYGISPGNDTTDQIFLLSITEVNTYMRSDRERACSPTAYVRAKALLRDPLDDNRWWLRSPGNFYDSPAYVGEDGIIYYAGRRVSYYYAVRPALWVDLESLNFQSEIIH